MLSVCNLSDRNMEFNYFESASDGIARTTNSSEVGHYKLQVLFQYHHPTLQTFIEGLEKDMQMHHATFVQGVSGLQPFVPKRYQSLKLRVENAIARYSRSEILVYLRGIACWRINKLLSLIFLHYVYFLF